MEKLYFNSEKKTVAALKPFRLFFMVLFVCLFGKIETANAALRTASVTGNWNDTATWGGSSVPAAGDAVVINSGVTVTVTLNAAVGSVSIYGILSIKDGINLTVGSNVSWGDLTVNSSGTFDMLDENGSQSIAALLVYGNYVNNGITQFWKGNAVIAGDLTSSTTSTIQNNGNVVVGGNIIGKFNTTGGDGTGQIYAVDPDATVIIDPATIDNHVNPGTFPSSESQTLIDLVNSVIYGGNCSFTVSNISNVSTCSGSNTSFSVSVSGATSPTYQWQVNKNDGAGWIDLSNDGTYSTVTAASLTISNVVAGMNAYQYRAKISVLSPSTCTKNGNPGVLTLVSANTAGTASSTPTLCINTGLTNITHTTTSATGISNSGVSGANGLPAGVSATWSSNTITISGTPTASGTFNYSIPLTGGCGTVYATGMITVSSVPDAPVLNNVTIACAATSFQLGTTTFASGFSDYKVDVATNDLDFSGSIIMSNFSLGGATPASTLVAGLIPGEIYYVQARAVNSCGTSPNSNTATISVPITRTTDGVTWTNGTPNGTQRAVFMAGGTIANITTTINACSCQIDPGVNVVVGAPGDANANAVLKIENGLNIKGSGTLTFENNASLIQTNNSPNINSGSIIYKRVSTPMNNFDYTYWSSPVTGQTLKALVPNTLPDKYFSWGTTNWVYETSTNYMTPPGKGYIIRRPKPGVYTSPAETVPDVYSQPVQFVGTPNNGHHVLPINSAAGSYNLIGNPYPSALSAEDFLTDNGSQLEGTIYFWTHNTAVSSTGYASADYASYNLTGGVGTAKAGNNGVNNSVPDGSIAAGQSFFTITKSGATGSVVFDNTMRVGFGGVVLDNSKFFRGTKSKTQALEKHRLWLNLTNSGGAFKQMLVGYVEGATAGYDSSFDGESFDGNSFVDFYSINENKNLTIQGRGLPFDAKDQVPLGYRSTIAGTFQISIDHTDGTLGSQPVYVEDKVTNIIHNLKNGPYSFTTAKGTFNDRLVLRYSNKALVDNSLGIEDVEGTQKGLVVSVKSHRIKINSFDDTIDKVMVYDLKGSLLYEKKGLGGNEFTIPNFSSSEQFLIVMVQLSNGKWITKEIIF